MKSLKRIDRYEPEEMLIPRLLSGLSEVMLRRIVISIVFASPRIRSLFFRLMMTSFLFGIVMTVVATVVVFKKAPWLFNWLTTFLR